MGETEILYEKKERKEEASTTDESKQRPANASVWTLTDMSQPANGAVTARMPHDRAFVCDLSLAQLQLAPSDALSVAMSPSCTKFKARDAVVYTGIEMGLWLPWALTGAQVIPVAKGQCAGGPSLYPNCSRGLL